MLDPQITTVLFDLDGTLLPMELEAFTKTYFGLLAKKAAPYGYEPEPLVAAVWKGTKAMVKNDGSKPNDQAFWDTFAQVLGEDVKTSISKRMLNHLLYNRKWNCCNICTSKSTFSNMYRISNTSSYYFGFYTRNSKNICYIFNKFNSVKRNIIIPWKTLPAFRRLGADPHCRRHYRLHEQPVCGD